MAEIAGNDHIMVSVLQAALSNTPPAGSRILYSFDGRLDGTQRRLLLVTVAKLCALLRGEGRDGYQVEHVFDY